MNSIYIKSVRKNSWQTKNKSNK